MRRRSVPLHRGLRSMVLRPEFLIEGFGIAILADLLLVWQGSRVLAWHSRAVEAFLQLAGVGWEAGKEIVILPGVSAVLPRTAYLDYQEHPWMPWGSLAVSLALLALGYRRCPLPLRPLLALLPLLVGITLFYLRAIAPSVIYTPEDFATIWYRGETFVWLLLPWMFALGFFILAVPLAHKVAWLSLLMVYAVLWSAVRLATALATFHFLGPVWMPFFYFVFGFLADFLYLVAFYSLAMDRAASLLARRAEARR